MAHDLSEILKHASPDTLALNRDIMDSGTIKPQKQRPSRRKYGNTITEVDGRKFDSKAEARHYASLLSLENIEAISNLECQPKFVLLPTFKDNSGATVRSITYSADFRYFDNGDGKIHVVDVKSKPTAKSRTFINSWKMLRYQYRNDNTIVFEIVVT